MYNYGNNYLGSYCVEVESEMYIKILWTGANYACMHAYISMIHVMMSHATVLYNIIVIFYYRLLA